MHKANKTIGQRCADIAVVGMAVRLPGARNVDSYWQNLRQGLSSIRKLSEEELSAAGVLESRSGRPDYVPYAAPLDNFADFDAEFFGLSPKEAAVMDPQHRQFLETAWEAMEHAGHPPESVDGQVGVYAGCGMGSYFYFNVCSNRDLVADTGMFLLRHTGNDKDFMSTRVSHSFDLKGPSLGIQTACSTSLVAIHCAAQALASGECDMALAGGVTIELPQAQGYVYKKNEILSPDGTCRAFDHRAQGTVFGSGAGVVVLRRLEDAISDGDHIWAVLKGSAINNDGAVKASYLAPSVEGQAEAVSKAHAAAGIDASSVGYVECHGTGTYLGDPIEIAALTDAFRRSTDEADFCRIGSVKTNIGHLDTAAGVASFVKATLALHNEEIPASLNFEEPNPAIGFEGSPFRVNAALTPWPRGEQPRRAGVNSLGVGGTNAHAVLEEAPRRGTSDESDWPFQLLTISARTKGALDAASQRLADHLEGQGGLQNLADIAFTLKEGRRAFDRRRIVVAESAEEGARLLREGHPRRVFTHSRVGDDPDTVFMFPGGGAQYAGMARDLYDTEPVFREWMDRGLDILQPKLDFDIRAVWLPEKGSEAAANARLQAPSVQLPLIMIVEYALSKLWMSWGVRPSALIGHSMGENAAACVAGVMTFEECIGLVLLRGRLFETVEKGGMLSVPLSEDEVKARIGASLDIASINAPGLCVVSGTLAELDRFEAELLSEGIEGRRIQIDIAAHSRLLEPILGQFREYLKTLDLRAPQIPFVSNRTGDWISDDEATDPDYWVAHLRNTIRFRDGLTTLSARSDRIYIEVGPGVALTSLAGQHDTIAPNQVVGSLRHPEDVVADDVHFMGMLGRVWATGGHIDWEQIWSGARRHRLPLPTYPFQHSHYFIERAVAGSETEDVWLKRIEDREKWAWRPVWKPAYADCEPDALEDMGGSAPETWLVFEDETGLGAEVARRLRGAGHTVISARPGDAFSRVGADNYVLAVERGQDSFNSLLSDLAEQGRMPTRLAHFWLVTGKETARPGSSFFHRLQEQGFWSLFHFSRAWAEYDGGDLHMTIVTSEAARVAGDALRYPAKATVAGPARVIPREFPGITCATLDISAHAGRGAHPALAHVLEELLARPWNGVAAVRGDKRFEQIWRQAELPKEDAFQIAPGSVVLLTGGLGGIGMTLAEKLAAERGAKVAVLTRRPLPRRADWDRIIRLSSADDKLARRLSKLKALEESGLDISVHAADVSNIEEMREAVEAIEARLGPIRGVIHAAGVIHDAPILAKDPNQIGDVFTPKIHGTQVLETLFPDGRLDWMVLFSSSSTVTAPAGQVDYVAANEYLNAVVMARTGSRTRVKVIDWGPWAEVGMAVDILEGVSENNAALGADVREPLLEVVIDDHSGNLTYLADWTTADLWVLDEHRTRDGNALLPGTGYIELAAEALAATGENGIFEIRDLTFLSPLRTPDDHHVSIRVAMSGNQDGFALSVESAIDGETFGMNAEAQLVLLADTEPRRIDLDAIIARCSRVQTAPEGGAIATPQSRHLDLGPRWQVVTAMGFGDDEGFADLRLTTHDEGYRLHPGMMDLATGFGLPLVEGYTPDQFWVPLSYGRVRVYSDVPQSAVSWIRSNPDNRATAETARFDVTIAAPDGTVCVEVEGFTVHRLSQGINFAKAAVARDKTGARAPSPAEERLRHTVEQGILPQDGADLFFRAMASSLPQVLISSLDLPGMIAQVEQDAVARPSSEAGFDRPDLDIDFVEPETEVEKRLAGFWSDLLGISRIGAEDNFFDLGGHSLIAVRLFAKVKSEFAVEFPISILFEAPTIRKCAALIAERVGDVAAPGMPAQEAEPQQRFMHLVPMHAGRKGGKTPFFMVAGMFGNVLNLRHLAHLIGSDRPFYGLQSRGLYGGAEPHNSLVEAARDYIAEIRQMQPAGPYMIGGFSGGGITAYEIARQLRDAGEDISALILLDTPLPQRRALTRQDRMALQLLKLREEGPLYPLRWARKRINWEFEKRKAPELQTDQTEFHNTAIKLGFLEAIGKYEVQPWNGPMTLFRPPLSQRWQVAPGRFVSESREYVNPTNDWDRYAPALEVFEVPGDHDSMVLEPNVRVLAVRMREVLDREGKRSGVPETRHLRAAE